MSDDADEGVLSPDLVDSLLKSVGYDESPKPRRAEQAAAPAPDKPKEREKTVAYDFKRPERVGKEQIRALQSVHEVLGRSFGASLSSLVRSVVNVQLVCVDQLTYSEFVSGLETPTCFNLLHANPLEGNLILDINPKILYPIIDRLLGGGKESTPPVRRPLTEIELRLVSRITNLFLQEMRHSWESIVELDLAVERVESNPHLVQIVPPNEVVILISFEITIGDTREMLNLCIPFNAIERIIPKLQGNSWVTYGKSKSTPETMALLAKQLDHVAVELSVTLVETRISTKELIGLRVGDIINTEKDIHQTVEVCVSGSPKYLARPGAVKGNKAIQIEQVLEGDPVDS